MAEFAGTAKFLQIISLMTIMVEFIKLKKIWIEIRMCFIHFIFFIIQSNNDSFFAVSSLRLPALRLHLCCCSVAKGSGRAATADIVYGAPQCGEDVEGHTST